MWAHTAWKRFWWKLRFQPRVSSLQRKRLQRSMYSIGLSFASLASGSQASFSPRVRMSSSVNLLALLLELRPDVPVLFEHTGAGHRGTHAQHAWAWVLWAGFVLLVDARMEVAAALDARALAALLGEG